MDLWEPDTEEEIASNEPVICHGGTMTSRLLLTAALNVINELAFERSRLDKITYL